MFNSNIKYQISNIRTPRVAIVHDWLYGGGAERVVEELHKLYPDAPIYTSYCSDEWRKKLDGKVITGYLQHPPFKQLRKFLPLLRQWWFRSLDLSAYDVVISSSGNGEAKFIRTSRHKLPTTNYQLPNMKRPLHINYCHTPTHFYWRHYNEYIQNPGFKPKWLARLGLKLLLRPMRKRDFKAAQKVDYFIANSTHIQKDIKKFYQRDSHVIHPPVNIKRFKNAKQPKQRVGYVTVGRQVPLKKTHLIIEACKQLNVPLTVIGNGPEHSRLVKMTGPTIHFKTNITDDELPEELASAQGFIFASFEDFGVAPIEAMAAGTPVIAYAAGGAIDYIVPGKTGVFFDKQTVESLVQTLESFDPRSLKSDIISKSTEQFSAARFREVFSAFLNETIKK
jgi:glycosyltransferase involved in cell wall biosynthesis